MNKTQVGYKIRQVIELTGVSEFLLRVWENRHHAFQPQRTITGRRLYSENDILRARALLQLTQNGMRIGSLAKLNLSQLNSLLEQKPYSNPNSIDNDVVQKIMVKSAQFEWADIRALILREKSKQEPLAWIHSIVLPILSEISRQSLSGDLSIAQEHILSSLIKESLQSLAAIQSPKKNAPRMVFATPEGDYHDIGIMIASFIAKELRANTLYLGPHMPMQELSNVCVRFKATHLVLTSTATKKNGAKDDYLTYLNFLDRNLNKKMAIWLGGINSQNSSVQLNRKFKIFDSFENYHLEVKKCLK